MKCDVCGAELSVIKTDTGGAFVCLECQKKEHK